MQVIDQGHLEKVLLPATGVVSCIVLFTPMVQLQTPMTGTHFERKRHSKTQRFWNIFHSTAFVGSLQLPMSFVDFDSEESTKALRSVGVRVYFILLIISLLLGDK